MKPKTKRILTVIIAVVLALAILASCILPALAADLDSLESDQSSLEQEAQQATNMLNATEEEIAAAQEKIDTVKEEIVALEADMKVITDRIINLNAKIQANELLLEQTEAELKTQQADLKEYYQKFKERIQMMYENDRTTYVELLFSARTLSDFFSRLEYISQVVEYDNNIIANMNACEEKIKASKDTIEQTKAALESDRAELVDEQNALQVKLDAKQAQMDSLNDDKLALEILRQEQETFAVEMWARAWENQALIDAEYAAIYAAQEAARRAEEESRLREQQESSSKPSEEETHSSEPSEEETHSSEPEEEESSEDPYEEESSEDPWEEESSDNEWEDPEEHESETPPEEDEEEIIYHPDASGREVPYGWSTWPGIGTGQLYWPIDSYLATDLYGPRTDPITGESYSFHSGLDLNAYYGQPVYASGTGQVVACDEGNWNDGFGNYVTIQHSDGVFMTSYCHLSSVAVSVGDYVEVGQVIGYAGSTGYSTGVHLHFMVYYGGGLTNPEWYL